MKSVNEFINDKNYKKRSAQAKLELLIYGVVDAPELFSKYENEFKEEHYAFNNGNWGVDKRRLTPTEILLPGGIVSKLHIRPDSPLRLIENDHALILCKGREELSEFRFLPRPNFWKKTMQDGDDPKRYAQMYGLNCLNFNIYSGCEFQNVGKGCKFCSVKATVDKENPIHIKKAPEKLAEICRMATESDSLKHILITGGSYIDSDYEFEMHIETLKAIRYNLPWHGRINGNVSMMPPKNMDRLKELYDCGVEYPSFNLEVWPYSAFCYYCPGKEKYVGFDHVINSLKKLSNSSTFFFVSLIAPFAVLAIFLLSNKSFN